MDLGQPAANPLFHGRAIAGLCDEKDLDAVVAERHLDAKHGRLLMHAVKDRNAVDKLP